MGTLLTNQAVSAKQVSIRDAFWLQYIELVRKIVIPYQYKAIHDLLPDTEPSHAIRNFRIAAGLEEGDFGGMVFQDSDVAKWLEAVGYSLMTNPDDGLEKLADEVIDLIGAAQQEDGYLNTYFTIKEPEKKWTNLRDCHEMYCAGHLIEAAVAYYRGTGKKKLLDTVCKAVDHIDKVFGPAPGQIQGYDGHQEIELALLKLYEITRNEQHLKLCQFFINERGKKPYFFLKEWENRGKTLFYEEDYKEPNPYYNQSHLPVREQTEAVGHAVRAVYMYTAMAQLAGHTNDQSLKEACQRLWTNLVGKQMYITGGIGSTHIGEAFTFDYDLPNDTVYAETCASIGLIFFARQMLQLEARREYADVLERALYNTVLSGISLDGQRYFYVNPLEVWPQACHHNPDKHHVKPVRQKWFGCACCPPNIARLIASLGEYIYSSNNRVLYTHLYISGETEVDLNGTPVTVQQETNYPHSGRVVLTVNPLEEQEFTLAVRIPGWCQEAKLKMNGMEQEISPLLVDGYAMIDRVWKQNDTIELEFPMKAELIQAHPQVRANAGKVAIQRGPLVYCIEEADNGSPLTSISISTDSPLTEKFEPELLGGVVTISGEGYLNEVSFWDDELYRPLKVNNKKINFKAVPYYAWGNREQGEMLVWIRM